VSIKVESRMARSGQITRRRAEPSITDITAILPSRPGTARPPCGPPHAPKPADRLLGVAREAVERADGLAATIRAPGGSDTGTRPAPSTTASASARTTSCRKFYGYAHEGRATGWPAEIGSRPASVSAIGTLRATFFSTEALAYVCEEMRWRRPTSSGPASFRGGLEPGAGAQLYHTLEYIPSFGLGGDYLNSPPARGRITRASPISA
jgi:hypothetical protein